MKMEAAGSSKTLAHTYGLNRTEDQKRQRLYLILIRTRVQQFACLRLSVT